MDHHQRLLQSPNRYPHQSGVMLCGSWLLDPSYGDEIPPEVSDPVTSKYHPPILPSPTRRDFENNILCRRGAEDGAPFLVMDPVMTQHWFESGGQYTGGISETTMDMAQNTWLVYMVFRRDSHEQWVLVVVVSTLPPVDPTKPIISKLQRRSFHIFNFSKEERSLKDVEAVVKRLYGPYTIGGAKHCQYPPVSADCLQALAAVLTLGRLLRSHHTACMTRRSS